MSYAAFKSQKELKKSDGAKRSRLIGAAGSDGACRLAGLVLPVGALEALLRCCSSF